MTRRWIDVGIVLIALAALLELVTALTSSGNRVMPWIALACMLVALVLLVFRRMREVKR